MKTYINLLAIMLLLTSCNRTPSEQIIRYTQEKYGDSFKRGNIDLAKVFNFEWQTLYIFPNWTTSEDIEEETGIKYNGGTVEDNYYLFLFIKNNKIVKKYSFRDMKIGFSDSKNGRYKINVNDAKFEINNKFWLYKIQ